MVTRVWRRTALATLTLVASPARAQSVRGRVVTDDGGKPASGAIVSLVTGENGRVAPALVDESGGYLVVAPRPGSYRLRVDMIGFQSWQSEPLTLAATDTAVRDVRLPLTRAALPTVSVSGETTCEAHPEQVPRLLAVWEEIRRALTINDISEQRGLVPVDLTVVREERVGAHRAAGSDQPPPPPPPPVARAPVVTTKGRNGTVTTAEPVRARPIETPRPTSTMVAGRTLRRQQDRTRSSGARPWATRSPADLAAHGYIRVVDGAYEYSGIDAPILLSSEFVATHCFRPVRKNALFGSDAVGLSFQPAPGRTLPDVEGTLWLDAKSSELRRVEFALVNLPDTLKWLGTPQGTLDFARLPAGTWYVRQWAMEQQSRVNNVPILKSAQGTATPLRRNGKPYAVARLAGVVVDSTVGDALAGATVYVPGLDPVVTDSVGRFAVTVSDLPSDSLELFVRIDHPRLSTLGLSSMEERVRVYPGRDALLEAAVPSVPSLAAALCPADVTVPSIVFGHAIRPDGSAVASGARVLVDWPSDEKLGDGVAARTIQRTATVEDDGRFRVCGVPIGRSLTLKLDGVSGAATELVVPSTGIAQIEITGKP